MKKNQIDELFASKLREHRLEPSERALELFNQRLDQKNTQRKLTPWYFGAAASLALASFGLYLMNQDEPQSESLASSSKLGRMQLPKVESLPETQIKTPLVVFERKNKVAKTTIVDILVEDEKTDITTVKNEIPKEKDLINESVLIEDSREIVSNGSYKPTTSPQTINQNKEEEVILTYEVEKLPQERLRRFDDEPIGLAQVIQFEENHFKHKNDFSEEPSILTKIGHQFKHLKKGEKINFRELGLRPRDILAKADRFLQVELGFENINKNKNNQTLGN